MAIMKYALFAVAAALILLFGCTGVSQEKYDALKSQCEQEKKTLSDSVATQKARAESADAKLGVCNNQRAADALVLESNQEENGRLKVDSLTLSQAREKTGKIAQYNQALAYYNDAFGPGKIPNSVKLNRLETQLNLLSDKELYAAWKLVKNCDSSTDCSRDKTNFTGTADAGISALAAEVVGIVKQD